MTSLFHFASTLTTQNEIKIQNETIFALFQNVLQQRLYMAKGELDSAFHNFIYL